MGFVHLHLHTEYSLLDGATHVNQLFKRVKELGMDAVAITEHGNLFSFVQKYKAAKDAGVKLIFGVEAYIVDDMTVKERGQKRYHLLLLAQNYQGFKNLLKLVSISHDPEHFYYKPRIDHALLEKHKEGIIVTSGCLAAEVPQALMADDYEKAKTIAKRYLDMFGKDNYFIELQDHGIKEQRAINPSLIRIAKELGLRCIATNDTHYLNKDDAMAQEVMLCIQTKSTMSDPGHMKFDTNEFYLKSEEEMRALFPDHPDAYDATVDIAARCDVNLELGTPIFPEFPVPDGMSEDEYLRKLCEQGFEEKYGKSPRRQEAKERMEFELATISNMGFPKYFLIVQDFIKAAKEFSSVGPGRGSVAGSLVAYVLGITQVEPLHLDLLFERFLNPDRISLPDIDIDFSDRDRVLHYVQEKYGHDKVALIGTVGTMQAKAVIKDVARALDIPFSISNEITKHIGEKTIQKSLDAKDDRGKPTYPELHAFKEKYPQLFEIAMRLEGSVRHAGIHACGVVWGPEPITEYTAVRYQEGYTVVQLDMNEVEDLGLVKFDFLGLETLVIIDKVLRYIEKDDEWLETIPMDDADVYAMLRRGESIGTFQLESRGMQRTLKEVQPTSFDDIIALVALYRPGPMEYIPVYARRKDGKEQVSYPHPKAREILEPTYGIMVYQEQVMQLSVALAGFSRGESDILRKAIGKKKLDLMQQMEGKFKEGCIKTSGMSPKDVDTLWDDIVKFASYSFNKSHAAAYGLIAYRTAYLKYHYPVEFMAALISSAIRDTEKMSFYLQTAKEMGIAILPPDINTSQADFSVEAVDSSASSDKDSKAIRFGLSGIKHVGVTVIEEIIEKRPFKDFDGFIKAVDLQKVNKRIIEALIKAGAFSSFEHNRAELLASYEQFMKAGRSTGQMTLFGEQATSVAVPTLPQPSLMERLTMEQEVLGVYVTGHPLDEYPQRGGLTSPDELKDGYDASVMGLVAEAKVITTRNGDEMVFLTIAHRIHRCEVIVFPSLYAELPRGYLEQNACVYVEGRVDNGKIIANRVTKVPKNRD